jgi:hypothetical protein
MSAPGEYGVASQMVSSEEQPTGGVKDVFSPSSHFEPALLSLLVLDPDALVVVEIALDCDDVPDPVPEVALDRDPVPELAVDCDSVLDDAAPGASKLASSDGGPSESKVRAPQATRRRAPNNDPTATVCTTERL